MRKVLLLSPFSRWKIVFGRGLRKLYKCIYYVSNISGSQNGRKKLVHDPAIQTNQTVFIFSYSQLVLVFRLKYGNIVMNII